MNTFALPLRIIILINAYASSSNFIQYSQGGITFNTIINRGTLQTSITTFCFYLFVYFHKLYCWFHRILTYKHIDFHLDLYYFPQYNWCKFNHLDSFNNFVGRLRLNFLIHKHSFSPDS